MGSDSGWTRVGDPLHQRREARAIDRPQIQPHVPLCIDRTGNHVTRCNSSTNLSPARRRAARRRHATLRKEQRGACERGRMNWTNSRSATPHPRETPSRSPSPTEPAGFVVRLQARHSRRSASSTARAGIARTSVTRPSQRPSTSTTEPRSALAHVDARTARATAARQHARDLAARCAPPTRARGDGVAASVPTDRRRRTRGRRGRRCAPAPRASARARALPARALGPSNRVGGVEARACRRAPSSQRFALRQPCSRREHGRLETSNPAGVAAAQRAP